MRVMEERGTRERILDVATDLFVEQGYDKTSLREIAERMGFTKAALYYHFTSKAEILMSLHLRLHRLIDDAVAELGDNPVTLAAWEKFLDQCIEKLESNRNLFVMHQRNSAALQQVHLKGHEGAHAELEERARALFSDQTMTVAERVRLAASFAVAFVTPTMFAGNLFPQTDLGQFAANLREIVHDILRG
jgi:AcrR family transcriptional regulator